MSPLNLISPKSKHFLRCVLIPRAIISQLETFRTARSFILRSALNAVALIIRDVTGDDRARAGRTVRRRLTGDDNGHQNSSDVPLGKL